MSKFRDMYRNKVSKGTDGSARGLRMQQSKDTYNRNFKDIIGYKEATYLDVDMLHNGEEPQPLDIVISTNTNGYERVITCRPDTLIKTGTYIYYEEMGIKKTAIVREMMKPEPVPTYKAFECSQKLVIKNCPFEFPCFSYNSTYSSKGLIDTDRNYVLDSRNKIYIQKNDFSCRLWQEYHGYRIIMGDEDGSVTFKITEMDDFSYKGMFIVSLKIEQKHHLDGVENPMWAYNEREIDFHDLIKTEDGHTEVEPLEIYSELYYKVGATLEVASNKDVTWTYDEEFFENIEVCNNNTLKGKLAKSGRFTVRAVDEDEQEVVRNIIIKER